MSILAEVSLWYALLWAFALGALVGLIVPWLLQPVLPEAVRIARASERAASSVVDDDWVARWLDGEHVEAAPAPRPSLKLHRGGRDGSAE